MPKLRMAALFSLLVVGASGNSAQRFVKLDWNKGGPVALTYSGVDYLGFGDFRVNQVTFRKPNGEILNGDLKGTKRMEWAAHRVTQTFQWGSVAVTYRAVGSRLVVTARVNNRSANVLESIWFEPLGLRFPSQLREYNGVVPLLTSTMSQPGVVRVSYAGGAAVIASEDGAKPVQVGLPWAIDGKERKVFPISINTGRVSSYPGSCPTIRRAIPMGQSDIFSVSIRFGQPDASPTSLAADIYRKFRTRSGAPLAWSDHRPIGALFLSTAAAGWPKNPRGWLQDSKLNVTTADGVNHLKSRILAYADASIGVLKKMNAQGMITWDIEGQQYPHATSYIGDPKLFETLAPEMSGIADEYFQRFRSAGLRVGVCIRPQRLVIAANGHDVSQTPVADPTQLLIDKAMYAKQRWGVTLFYVDSNVNSDDLNPIDARVFKKLATALPDALFIPEHSTTEYYAYSAPYRELRQGHSSTDPDVRLVYPGGFSVIYTADGPIDGQRERLIAAVRHGDILLFRGWFDDPQNVLDNEIYQRAMNPDSAHAKDRTHTVKPRGLGRNTGP